jgi:leucyl aminopeptidase
MRTKLQSVQTTAHDNLIILSDRINWEWANEFFTTADIDFLKKSAQNKGNFISTIKEGRLIIVEFLPNRPNVNAFTLKEMVRRDAAKRISTLKEAKIETVTVINHAVENFSYEYVEGLFLANYQFLKFFANTTKRDQTTLHTISVLESALSAAQVDKLNIILESVCTARDWINEPLSHFNAVDMANSFTDFMKDSDVKVTVLHKKEIELLKMGGLLGVNKGSINTPTFTIAEYKPAHAKNTQPIVLVGKGVTFDTGGLSIKPTTDSMDHMKCDMAGAALVMTTIKAAADMKLPLHIVALVPATDNIVDANAIVPGDILTMYNGATVEVLNTDAEGRLILADALHYAKRYNPALVMDFATLTGAAARAVGQVGCVMFSNADRAVTANILNSGYETYERAAEFMLWDEYLEMTKSDIADLRNTAGPLAGAHTAAKFLEFFTDYPWMHFDIAAMAFFAKEDGYLVKGGTGWGVRFLYHFLEHYK